MKKVLYYGALLILLGIFAYSAYQIGSYLTERHKSSTVVEEARKYVSVSKGVAVETGDAEASEDQINVDFEDLKKISEDVVAWLYGPDSRFNYPVVQGSDNDYYLYRLMDGTCNINGTLFLDYRCSPDFSDASSVIYGHHMKTGDMFGTLVKYKEQSYYDTHPYLYLITPTQKYRMDLFAGCIVKSDAEIYQGGELNPAYLAQCRAESTFQPPMEIVPDGPILILSTCSYEFENARYVVLGVLVPISG